MSDIVDKGIVRGDRAQHSPIGGLMLLVSIVATASAPWSGATYASKVATGFTRILRGAIFARVERFSIHQFRPLQHRVVW